MLIFFQPIAQWQRQNLIHTATKILKIFHMFEMSCVFINGQNNIMYLYRVSQEERTKLQEGVPYVKLYRYNPKHLCPKLNGYW